jgi:uncharacterized protein DUF642
MACTPCNIKCLARAEPDSDPNATREKATRIKIYLAKLLALSAAFAPVKLPAQVFVYQPSSGVQQNLVYNGSFEMQNEYGGYDYEGWTLSGGLVSLGGAASGVQCADGVNAVGLDAQSSLYQDISTVAGQQYKFSFFMADWGVGSVPPNVVYLNPSFGSTLLGLLSFDGTGKTYQDMGWVEYSYTVVATGTTSRIMFSNPADTRWPMIDDVWVTPVPEPTLFGLLVLGGLTIMVRCRRVVD